MEITGKFKDALTRQANEAVRIYSRPAQESMNSKLPTALRYLGQPVSVYDPYSEGILGGKCIVGKHSMNNL